MNISFNRILMIFLILGVWALVLKPNTPNAHSGQNCYIENFYAYGNGEGEGYSDDEYVYVEVEVEINDADAIIICE